MFAKQPAAERSDKGHASAPPAPMLDSPAARKPPRVASLVADDMTIEGGITGEGELHVDGVIKGDVRIGRLTLGESGHIIGNVIAEAVEARGKVTGSISAKMVRLFATAYVEGDVAHEQLAMETGAYFEGRSFKLNRTAPASGNGASSPAKTLELAAPVPPNAAVSG